MKKYFTLFLYISLLFLIVTLIKADFLFIPTIYSLWKVIFSLILLFLGFVFDAIAWHKTINYHGGANVKFSDSIASMGLSVFGKYIPGKFWTVLGRAGFLAKRYDLSEKDTAIVSLNAQFISLWVGLLLSGCGVLLIGDASRWGLIALVLWVLLSFILFTRIPYKIFEKVLNKVFNGQITIPNLDIKNIARILHWFFLNWILWIASFYFFVDALTATNVNYVVGSIFAIGGTLGLVVLIAPGGIGVREGIIFAFLILSGLDAPIATTISIASRLWFLSGEFFIFSLGVILGRRPT